MDFASPDTADTPSARRTPRGALPVSARAHRTTYHHGDLRNALLQEAIARVTVHGYRALVGREIALALGVAPAAANGWMVIARLTLPASGVIQAIISLAPGGGASGKVSRPTCWVCAPSAMVFGTGMCTGSPR